ncbi:MAG: CAP domain-containing protein [Hyphomicrobiales bacterium]|nr:CAP domain-containing protein [Hyphomicrobiales bacterium]
MSGSNGLRWGCCVLAAALVSACAGDRDPPASGEPSFYRSMATADAQVDAAAAASMISGYRRNNGLGTVTLDPVLMRLALEQARAMATRDRLDHDVGRGFSQRIAGSGYDARAAYENIGAGYHTLAEAFSGWRGSPGHRANMLRPEVTQIGIAAAYQPRSKYKVFWALILAAPDVRQR